MGIEKYEVKILNQELINKNIKTKTELLLHKGDITKMDVDAIVNAANSSLMGGGGADGAIHHAGGPVILKECREIIKKIGHLQTGKAVITTGGNLKAKYVIHTVGPVWYGGKNKEAEMLSDCYENSLLLTKTYNIKTIAFPSISTGVYGYPKEKAAIVAINAVKKTIEQSEIKAEKIYFVLFSDYDFEIYKNLLKQESI